MGAALTVGCGPAPWYQEPPRRFRKNADIALVVQSGHADPIDTVHVEASTAPIHLTTRSGADARLWRQRGAGRGGWELLWRFSPLVERTELLPERLVLFRTTTGAWIFDRPRGFGAPALGPRQGLPSGDKARYRAWQRGEHLFVAATGLVEAREVTRLYHATSDASFERVDLPVPEDQLGWVAPLPQRDCAALTTWDRETHLIQLQPGDHGERCPKLPAGLDAGPLLSGDTVLDRTPRQGGRARRLWRLTPTGVVDQSGLLGPSSAIETITIHTERLIQVDPAQSGGEPWFLWRSAPTGPWVPLAGQAGLPDTLRAVRALAGGAFLMAQGPAGDGWHARVVVGGTLQAAAAALPGLSGPVADAVSLGDRGVGVRTSGVAGPRQWFLRSPQGQWRPVAAATPAAPDGLRWTTEGSLLVGDADQPSAAGGVVALHDLGEGALEPAAAWLRAAGWLPGDAGPVGFGATGDTLWVDLARAGDAPWRRFFWRSDGRWGPLNLMPFQAPAASTDPLLALPARVLAVARRPDAIYAQVPPVRGSGPAPWVALLTRRGGVWAPTPTPRPPLTAPPPAGTDRPTRGRSPDGLLLAEPADELGPGRLRLMVRDVDADADAARRRAPVDPAAEITAVAFPESDQLVAVHNSRSAFSGQRGDHNPWQVLARPALTPLGRAPEPVWFGLSFRASGDAGGRRAIDGATHVVDGQIARDVAPPVLWLRGSEGPTLGAVPVPALGEQGVLALGLGPAGQVAVLDQPTGPKVLAITQGSLRFERLALQGQRELRVLVNDLGDGLSRIHQLAQPHRWVWRFTDPEDGQTVHFLPDGAFFADSDALADQVTFRIDDELLSFGQLAAYLFRPDRLEAQLGLKPGAWFSLTADDRRRLARAQRLAPNGVALGQLRPPRVAVKAPPPVVDQELLDLHITAQGNGAGPGALQVHLLGAGQQRSGPIASKARGFRRVSLRQTVRLLPGENRIKVTLTDADHLTADQVVSVTYRPRVAQRPRLRAVLVGSATYGDPAFPPLPMVANDLRAAAQALRDQRGSRFRAVSLHTLCEAPSCDGPPTRAGIQEALADAREALQHGDHFLVYVSGHGITQNGEYYVVPRDGRAGQPHTLLSWSELQAAVAHTPTLGKRLVVLDTCHAGAAKGHGDASRRVQQAMERDGLYMLTATSAGTQAFEFAELGNGLFTHALVRGLAGAADLSPSDGQVRFEELAHYLVREVAALARQRGVRQTSSAPFVPALLDYQVAQVPRGPRLSLSVRDQDGLDAPAAERARWVAKVRAAAPEARLVPRRPGVPALVLVVHPDRLLVQLKDHAGAEVMRSWRLGKRLPAKLLTRLRPNERPCPPGVGKGGQVVRCPRPR